MWWSRYQGLWNRRAWKASHGAQRKIFTSTSSNATTVRAVLYTGLCVMAVAVAGGRDRVLYMCTPFSMTHYVFLLCVCVCSTPCFTCVFVCRAQICAVSGVPLVHDHMHTLRMDEPCTYHPPTRLTHTVTTAAATTAATMIVYTRTTLSPC